MHFCTLKVLKMTLFNKKCYFTLKKCNFRVNLSTFLFKNSLPQASFLEMFIFQTAILLKSALFKLKMTLFNKSAIFKLKIAYFKVLDPYPRPMTPVLTLKIALLSVFSF